MFQLPFELFTANNLNFLSVLICGSTINIIFVPFYNKIIIFSKTYSHNSISIDIINYLFSLRQHYFLP